MEMLSVPPFGKLMGKRIEAPKRRPEHQQHHDADDVVVVGLLHIFIFDCLCSETRLRENTDFFFLTGEESASRDGFARPKTDTYFHVKPRIHSGVGNRRKSSPLSLAFLCVRDSLGILLTSPLYSSIFFGVL